MVEAGQRLFKPTRSRTKAHTPSRRTRRRVSFFPHDNPGDEQTSNQTLTDLLSTIRRKRPSAEANSAWTFVVGGKRDYVAINTQGPRAFSGQYPVWSGRTFKGSMLYQLEWSNVRTVLEKFYDGCRSGDCFAEGEGSFVRYAGRQGRRR
jgi:hypothetical protein